MGNDLFKEVTDLTGLPKEEISTELRGILDAVGSDPKTMTIEELRAAMLRYLDECFADLPES